MIVIINQLSENLSDDKKPHINSIRQNNGNVQLKETLNPSFNVIDETQYNMTVVIIIITEFNMQLNHG